jgi:hypothetical protein
MSFIRKCCGDSKEILPTSIIVDVATVDSELDQDIEIDEACRRKLAEALADPKVKDALKEAAAACRYHRRNCKIKIVCKPCGSGPDNQPAGNAFTTCKKGCPTITICDGAENKPGADLKRTLIHEAAHALACCHYGKTRTDCASAICEEAEAYRRAGVPGYTGENPCGPSSDQYGGVVDPNICCQAVCTSLTAPGSGKPCGNLKDCKITCIRRLGPSGPGCKGFEPNK